MNSSRAQLAIAITATLFGSASVAGVVFTTPPGVTLIEVTRELPTSQPEILWIALGSPKGQTLLINDKDPPGASNCLGKCASEFQPMVAGPGAAGSGDWSVVQRADGVMQWAYQSKPLYSWSAEKTPAEVATNVGLTETATAKFAENAVVAGSLLPPEGWQVARFKPASSVKLPDGVDVRLVGSVQAVALTDAQGLTLYGFSGEVQSDKQACAVPGCENRWRPLSAAALAAGKGDFSVVGRADGTKQWAFKGRPLYTYGGDNLPGDALGAGVDPRWTVAVLTENFLPARVGVTSFEGYGDALTLDGMTLYGGYAFEKRWGGRNLRDTFTNVYSKGKKLGAAACADQTCIKSWKPFMAPEDAQPNGFWEPIKRPDGTAQWAYKGYALYTFAGDKVPGEYNGQATYDFATAEEGRFDYKRVSSLQEISKAAVAGVYWNIAKP